MYMLTCQSLQVQLGEFFAPPACTVISLIITPAERTEEASKAMAARRELARRMEDISRDFDEEQKLTFEIRQDMTRQYKGMQEELLSRVRSSACALCRIKYYIFDILKCDPNRLKA